MGKAVAYIKLTFEPRGVKGQARARTPRGATYILRTKNLMYADAQRTTRRKAISDLVGALLAPDA